MSAQNEDELAAVETSIETTLQRLYQLRRHRNFLASTLLRLPTELVLKIFECAIELSTDGGGDRGGSDDDSDDEDDTDTDSDSDTDSDEHDSHHCRLEFGIKFRGDHRSPASPKCGPTLLVLVAICHKLRQIGITTPRLWNTVNLDIPSLAKIHLKWCNYDPHTLTQQSRRARKRQSTEESRKALWKQLEGRPLNNLRSLVFKGGSSEFRCRFIPILQTATNLSSLDLESTDFVGTELPWNSSSPFPHLSTLRLYGFSISWTLPLLRNLTQLSLDHGSFSPLTQHTPTETVLAALANCPALESLRINRPELDSPSARRDSCDPAVQLPKLQSLCLGLQHSSTAGHILSRLKYPQSAHVDVTVPTDSDHDISGTISRILPPDDASTLKNFQHSKTLTIYLDNNEYAFSTDKSTIRCRGRFIDSSHAKMTRAASKTLEVVGGETVTYLSVRTWHVGLTGVMWEKLLQGLPQLERISYRCHDEDSDLDVTDPFISAIYRLYQEKLICPRLQHLELPEEVLDWESSAATLKHALMVRESLGARLKRLGLNDGTTELGNRLMLQRFVEHVDEIVT